MQQWRRAEVHPQERKSVRIAGFFDGMRSVFASRRLAASDAGVERRAGAKIGRLGKEIRLDRSLKGLRDDDNLGLLSR